MNGDLHTASASKVTLLLIKAIGDLDDANLDRTQGVKDSLDTAGQQQKKLYNVVRLGRRKPDTDGRSAVDNTIDAASPEAHWRDPAFGTAQRPVYYVRVLEISTPRWTAFDAKYLHGTLPTDVPTRIQERADTSPSWYTPAE